MNRDLLLISLEAHRKYAISRMSSRSHQKQYNEIYSIAYDIIDYDDNYTMGLAAIEEVLNQFKLSKYSLGSELKYKKLAIKHINDVVLSINTRFK